MKVQQVSTVSALVDAGQDPSVSAIEVTCDLEGLSSLQLSPGQTIRSRRGEHFTLRFAPGLDGLRLSADNRVSSLALHTSPDRRAVWNDDAVSDLGTLLLEDLSAVGQVQLVARNKVRRGHVEVRGLDIVAADTTGASERPHGYGVSVLQGAFTLWNMQIDENVVLTANLRGISVGRAGAPVLGGGIFVSGAGNTGGRLAVQQLHTGPVFTDGRIPPGTPDIISGGVFVVYGASVDVVRTEGSVITYGPNDMALDNWGAVERWISTGQITTYGPSGIGFVNFGTLGLLRCRAPIETFGAGARGFNVYTGTVRLADFDRIITHGDGAVGVQIAEPIGELRVRRGVETFGATGPSLVKGVLQTLSAIALSIKPGGSAERIRLHGGLKTHGEGTQPLEQLGSVQSFQVTGGFTTPQHPGLPPGRHSVRA